MTVYKNKYSNNLPCQHGFQLFFRQYLMAGKASGPDLMHPRLLKIASTILKYPLSKLFNKSLQSSYFPHMWKLANVTPVFKNKGEKDCL
jgi:hypothetical protein